MASFAYHPETDKLIVAVGGSKTASSFAFYSVDLDTSVATLINDDVARGDSEASSPAYYSPYISSVDLNGTSVYRLGYQEVT